MKGTKSHPWVRVRESIIEMPPTVQVSEQWGSTSLLLPPSCSWLSATGRVDVYTRKLDDARTEVHLEPGTDYDVQWDERNLSGVINLQDKYRTWLLSGTYDARWITDKSGKKSSLVFTCNTVPF